MERMLVIFNDGSSIVTYYSSGLEGLGVKQIIYIPQDALTDDEVKLIRDHPNLYRLIATAYNFGR